MRDQRREERRGERLPGGGNESRLGLGGRAAGAGAYIAQQPTAGSPPQRDDPTVTGGAGGRLRRAHRAASVPHGPRPCLPVPPLLSGRARASAVGLDRGPGTARAWHGPGTSPPAPGPDRDSAVLSWAGPVPAQRARPSWPAIVVKNQQSSH